MDCLSHAIAMDIKLFHFQIYEFEERAKLLYLKFGMLYIYIQYYTGPNKNGQLILSYAQIRGGAISLVIF